MPHNKHVLGVFAATLLFVAAAVPTIVWLQLSRWVIIFGLTFFATAMIVTLRLIEWKEQRTVKHELRTVSNDSEED